MSNGLIQDSNKTYLTDESRYKLSNVVQFEGQKVFDVPVIRKVPKSSSDQYLIVTSEYVNRIDKVAKYYYNNPRLWWVIASINNIDDPMILPMNTVLRIPPINILYSNGVIR